MNKYSKKKGLIGYLSMFAGIGIFLFLGISFVSGEVWNPLSTSEGSRFCRFVWFVCALFGWSQGFDD